MQIVTNHMLKCREKNCKTTEIVNERRKLWPENTKCDKTTKLVIKEHN